MTTPQKQSELLTLLWSNRTSQEDCWEYFEKMVSMSSWIAGEFGFVIDLPEGELKAEDYE